MGRIAKEVSKAAKKAIKEAKVDRAEQLKKLTLPGTKKAEAAKLGKETIDVLMDEPTEAAASRIDVDIPTPELPTVAGAVARKTGQPVNPVRKEVDVATVEEAQRIGELRLDDFDSADLHQPNFDTFETTDDVTAVVADLAERNKGRINEARRGTIKEDQLRKLANDLDLEEDVLFPILEREVGSLDGINAETVLAARQVLNQSAKRIKSLADQIVTGTASDIDKLKFRRQLMLQREFANNFLENFMGVRAEAGRLLNAFGVPTEGLDADINTIREMVEVGAGKDIDDVIKAIAMQGDAPTTGQITSVARQYTQSKMMGTVNELFVNSILSSPKTHIINIAGNAMMQTMAVTERAVAARIGRFLSSGEEALVGEASAMMTGELSAFRDAMVIAGRSAKTGIALDDIVKFESTRRRSISAEHLINEKYRETPLGRALSVILDGYRYQDKRIVPGIGQVLRAPTERVMLPADEFFKTTAYRSELARLAYRDAYQLTKAGELTPDQVAGYVKNFMENPTTNIVKAADDYARYVTFQNPLGPRGAKAQLFLRSTPAFSLVAPFVRTPVNIFTAGIVQRSPVAFFTRSFREAVKQGGQARDMALARATMGTMTSGFIAHQTMLGNVTGHGPSEPEARRLLEADGWQPYSIKLPDGSYVSYARAEPLAFVIGATADTVEIIEAINNAPEGFHEDARSEVMTKIIPAIAAGIANNTMSKTYLQGVVDFMEASVTDPGRYMPAYLNRMATSMVPYSAGRRAIAGVDDPYMREARTLIENLRVNAGIPGWSQKAPPSRDIFGNRREKKAGDLLGVMSPFPRTEGKNDPVTKELIRVMDATRQVPVNMPFPYIDGMRMTTKEYEEYVVAARREPAPSNGLTFYDKLAETMASPEYKNASADDKVGVLRDIKEQYDKVGRAKMLEENRAGLGDRYAEWKRYQDEQKFGVK